MQNRQELQIFMVLFLILVERYQNLIFWQLFNC